MGKYLIIWGPNGTLFQKHRFAGTFTSRRDAIEFDTNAQAQEFIDKIDRLRDHEKKLCIIVEEKELTTGEKEIEKALSIICKGHKSSVEKTKIEALRSFIHDHSGCSVCRLPQR